jgi:hypothetical protein
MSLTKNSDFFFPVQLPPIGLPSGSILFSVRYEPNMYNVDSVHIIPSVPHTYLRQCVALIRRTNGGSLRTLQKSSARRTLDRRVLPALFFFQCYNGRADQTVSRHLLTAKACVRSRTSSCEIHCGQSGTGAGFSPRISFFPCHYHSTNAPYTSSIYTDLDQKDNPANLQTQ